MSDNQVLALAWLGCAAAAACFVLEVRSLIKAIRKKKNNAL